MTKDEFIARIDLDQPLPRSELSDLYDELKTSLERQIVLDAYTLAILEAMVYFKSGLSIRTATRVWPIEDLKAQAIEHIANIQYLAGRNRS